MIGDVFSIILLCSYFNSGKCIGRIGDTSRVLDKIAFVILSQPNEQHRNISEILKSNIAQQATQLNVIKNVEIYKSFDDFGNSVGHWTVIPLLQKMHALKDFSFIFFLEEHTVIKLSEALRIISTYNALDDVFVGYALMDSEPTIIHHFDSADAAASLPYPHFSAGFFISSSLLAKLDKPCEDCQFSIDPKYELAKFIWNSAGVRLRHDPRLCLEKDEKCASWIHRQMADCTDTVPSNSVYVAVKTCQKYHKDRVRVVKQTWGPDVDHLLMFSDFEDSSISTIRVDVDNVEVGHCEKTLSIMKFFLNGDIKFDWLAIVDDDTLLSFPRLKRLLSCYDSRKDLALGERYGYGVVKGFGYDYLTGGSGMVFSYPTVSRLVSGCRCPSPDSPDDMMLGSCLKNLNIPVTHSSLFHQARPFDYAPDFLSPWKHISFHKHWMLDPIAVYESWLAENGSSPYLHSEL